MAHIEPVFSKIPPSKGDVDYSPLGGEVGLEAADVAKIQAVERRSNRSSRSWLR